MRNEFPCETQSGGLPGGVKRQCAELRLRSCLPPNSAFCRAFDRSAAYNLHPGLSQPELVRRARDGRTVRECAAIGDTNSRSAGFVEGNCRLFQPRRDDGAALGEAGRDARSPAPPRQDGLGLRFSDGVGRLGARPESPGSAGEWAGYDHSRSSCPSPAQSPASSTRWKFFLLLAVAAVVLAIGAILWLQRTEYFWRNPIADSRFQTVTDFDGVQEAAAVSRDGHFVAFLSDQDGQMDVWVTQVGSGEFHNLTRGSIPDLANPSIRTLGFSPDGSLVTFWVRQQDSSMATTSASGLCPRWADSRGHTSKASAEFDWSPDGSRLAYHTPGAGDPLFVSDGTARPRDRPIFTAPLGLHSHFPVWSPDATFIYFVQGSAARQIRHLAHSFRRRNS